MFSSRVVYSLAGGISAAVAYKLAIDKKRYGVVCAAAEPGFMDQVQSEASKIRATVRSYGSEIQRRVDGYKTAIVSEVSKELAKDITLYWGSGSPPCWKVMIALEEKGLGGYNSKLLSFSKKENKSKEVMDLNPRGQVPTLRHAMEGKDVVICESEAAVLYIESIFCYNQLIPDDLPGRALVLQRMTEAQNLHNKGIVDMLFYKMSVDKKNIDAKELDKKKTALLEELNRWESYLQKSSGAYLCGSDLTAADIMFFPTLAILVRTGLQLKSRFPRLARYYDTVCRRPSVQSSWPPHWNEGPGPAALNDV